MEKLKYGRLVFRVILKVSAVLIFIGSIIWGASGLWMSYDSYIPNNSISELTAGFSILMSLGIMAAGILLSFFTWALSSILFFLEDISIKLTPNEKNSI